MATTEDIAVVVITPERQVLEDAADGVVIPAHDGEVGILRDRAALLCELGIGQLRYSRGGRTRRVFIDGGFAQVLENRVTVLTAQAVPAEDVSADAVNAAESDIDRHRGRDEESCLARERAQRRWRVLRNLSTHR